MLLGGLWHGAKWTFVVWGALHGIYLWIEKAYRDRKKSTAEKNLITAPETKDCSSIICPPEINHPKNLRNFTHGPGYFFPCKCYLGILQGLRFYFSLANASFHVY